MKDLFIFDMGGVLCLGYQILPEAARGLGMPFEELRAAVEPDIVPYMDGAIDGPEFWRRFSGRTGRAVGEDYWITGYNPRIDPRMAAFIAAMATRGRAVCGTNTIDVHYEYHRDRGDYDVFDKVYASHLLGVSKPKPDFWRRILEAEGRSAGEAVFIDDLEENVQAARGLGMDARLYSGDIRELAEGLAGEFGEDLLLALR